MTALEILRSVLEANKEVSSAYLRNILVKHHGYTLSMAYKVIKEAELRGWIRLKVRNRRGVAVYVSTLYQGDKHAAHKG
ncbi:MAG: hypothetical protein DRJ69_05815 [Thermoprotei archaeon]|nr:MAG: hypothetical protein DRJ69_05815 [Thermoprotei archaeon]